MLVVDAGFIGAALIDDNLDGHWAVGRLRDESLVAPHLLFAEVASLLRRSHLASDITAARASEAHHRLLSLPVQLVPYEPFAARVWELRSNVTPYDAWYVAIAESLRVPLATTDIRLSRASGPRCKCVLPPRRH